jgi:prepilin-type N-terminal cleavage/methylation domain-containing protein
VGGKVTLGRSEHGFTLVEMLVAIALTAVVFGSVLTVLDVFQRDNRFNTLRNEAQDSARSALDALARELRNGAAPSSLTPGALEKAGHNSIVFQTIEPTTKALPEHDENVTNAIRVRYCLNRSNLQNEILWKQTLKWTKKQAPPLPTATECPDLNGEDYETHVQVAQNIVNAWGGRGEKIPLFKYVPEGVPVGEITGVEPEMVIDVNPAQRFPGETQLKTTIDLRNENRPPTAAFTAKEIGGNIVELNGTQSTDPDGLSLTYTWFDNGVQLASRSSLTYTAALEHGSKHTFKLVVATPSGLEASTESAPMTI